MTVELIPPESLQPAPLTPPAPVAAVAPAQADNMVKLDPQVATALDAKVQEFVTTAVTSEVNSPPFEKQVQ